MVAGLRCSGNSHGHCLTRHLRCMGCELSEDRFRAANGSRVNIDGSTTVSVWVGFKKKNDNLGRFPVYRQAKLKGLVGGISHNIISTNTLCDCGWEFNQNSQGTEVTHPATGLRLDVCVTSEDIHGLNLTQHGCTRILNPLHNRVNL